jgi:hypothetical protein
VFPGVENKTFVDLWVAVLVVEVDEAWLVWRIERTIGNGVEGQRKGLMRGVPVSG